VKVWNGLGAKTSHFAAVDQDKVNSAKPRASEGIDLRKEKKTWQRQKKNARKREKVEV
jgi:hypothetical protein